MAETAVPAVMAVRELVESIAPAPAPWPPSEICPQALDAIVRWEVLSPEHYTRALQGLIWPQGQSGVTWGVGYDGGMQTRQQILSDWAMHQQVTRLATTSGIVGPPAALLLPGLADIRVPYTLAYSVFRDAMLPAYEALAQRTFRRGWDGLPACAKGALVATVMNRGASMTGDDRRREMRALRDDCVPRFDTECMAAQFRSMPRLWVGTAVANGLRDRYLATARLALIPD